MYNCKAANVLTLKNKVPTNWIRVDHQSIRFGSHIKYLIFSSILVSKLLGAADVSTYWRKEALVKNMDPMKYVRLA